MGIERKAFITVMCFMTYAGMLAAQQPVQLEEISPGLYQISGGRGANGGLCIGDNGVLVIDAKMNRESVDAVMDEIKKLTDLPLLYLINTHSDGDHAAGNRYFPETVTIISHENCREEFFHPRRDGSDSEWLQPELRPYLPAVTFRENMEIHLGYRTVQVWYFGVGHTTGDAVVYFPKEKTAFLGDQIFMGRPQLIHAYKGGNSFAHVRTLSRMLDTLPAKTFCSGHADPVGREDIEEHINRMKAMQEKIRSLMQAGDDLETVLNSFAENESRLVEVIYNEITEGY